LIPIEEETIPDTETPIDDQDENQNEGS
jgi:hypothetical protein